MADLPLFVTAGPIRDRALGMIWGAACGARAADGLSSSWPDSDDMLTHLSESLLDREVFDPSDLMRRLIRSWCERAGRPQLVDPATTRPDAKAFVAGLIPISILRRGRQRMAQKEASELATAFQAGSAEGEALEVMTLFLRRALLGLTREDVLDPFDWEGDPRVGRVTSGKSLPIETHRDLVAAVDQTRGLAMRRIPIAAAFTALASVHASDAAFVLGGALIGAFDGAGAFVSDPHLDRRGTPSARLEHLVDRLLAVRPPAGHDVQREVFS